MVASPRYGVSGIPRAGLVGRAVDLPGWHLLLDFPTSKGHVVPEANASHYLAPVRFFRNR